tara:strand:+ start:424 stop:666 length:243 start_codon:yes stop_codon:yes gene_type:complete
MLRERTEKEKVEFLKDLIKKVQRKNTEDRVDNFVATNWHLKFRLEIEELKKQLEKVTIERNIALRKLKKLKVKNEHKTTV